MADNIKKIAFLMDKSSIVVKGLEKRTQAAGYETISIAGNFDKLGEQIKDASVVVLYNLQDIIEDKYGTKNLLLIKDQIADHDCNLILIGEALDREVIMKAHPEFIACRWIDRPVDPDLFITEIEDEIERHVEKLIRKQLEKEEEETKEKKESRENKEAPAPAGPVDDGDPRKKILIVDDDSNYAGMVRSWIKDKYKTDIVTAGMQAITFLMKKKVDLILLDYEMPVVDGPQVLQMLRQEETTKNIPVVFLTGVSTVEGVKRVMELKPLGYILKSTTSEDLIKFLDEKLLK
jgi:CheY-like chemotaxis protein